MPDFFDRLVARDARLGGGPAVESRTAHLEHRAGVIRTFPRLPIPFEWPDVTMTEQVTETDSAPGWPAGAGEPADLPRTSPSPTAALERPGYPRPGPPPAAYRGAKPGFWPEPAFLVPPAVPAPGPALAPADAAAAYAFAPRQEYPVTPPESAVQPNGAGPAAAGRTGDGPPPRQPLPRGPAGAAGPPYARDTAITAGRPQRHATRPAERVVQVRIGRIEVRPAEAAEHPRAGRPPGRPEPQVSLDRFLAGEDGGR